MVLIPIPREDTGIDRVWRNFSLRLFEKSHHATLRVEFGNTIADRVGDSNQTHGNGGVIRLMKFDKVREPHIRQNITVSNNRRLLAHKDAARVKFWKQRLIRYLAPLFPL